MSVLKLSEEAMARKINHERTNQERRPSRNITDEEERHQKDLAQQWIDAKEKRIERHRARVEARKRRKRNRIS